MKRREIHLVSRPQGAPTLENFELVEATQREPTKGEILVRNEWLSVDPYMRGRMRDGKSYVDPFQLNEPLEGGCVGKIIASENPNFEVGDYVLSNHGWRDMWCSDGAGVTAIEPERAPIQSYLGVLGLTGMTARVDCGWQLAVGLSRRLTLESFHLAYETPFTRK